MKKLFFCVALSSSVLFPVEMAAHSDFLCRNVFKLGFETDLSFTNKVPFLSPSEKSMSSYDRARYADASPENPVLMEDAITNPSFESNSLSGWTNDGMAAQTNNSPADQGWQKDGTVYAERWRSTSVSLGDASIIQRVSGLPDGKYVLKVRGHAVNQSGTPAVVSGAAFFAGRFETPVSVGGEYEVEAVTVDGYLDIGMKAVNSDANWIACDNFRLYYLGRSLDAFKELLFLKLKDAVEDTVSAGKPGYFNQNGLAEAIKKAESVEQTEDAVVEAIHLLDAAMQETETIISEYEPLKNAIEGLKGLIESSGYPDESFGKLYLDKLENAYNGAEDARKQIPDLLALAEECMARLSDYERLGCSINSAELLINNSNYPGRSDFRDAINEIRDIYDEPSDKDINEALKKLAEASDAYVATRRSMVVNVRNGAMWKDNRGIPVQAHGAGFVQVGETWYMIGEDRSKSVSDINMYKSKDLKNWTFVGNIVSKSTHPALADGTRFIERPKIMYCAKTGQFVIWCHWEGQYYEPSEAAVFYSDNVEGPYKFHWGGRPMGIASRDCNVFVDDDGKAYFISTTNGNHDLGLFELSDDYLDIVKHTTIFAGQGREAPALVRVGDTYYMLSSACSGWDPNQCKVAWSKSLTSGWSSLRSIGNPIAFDTQAASILKVKGGDGTSYLYVGDRWQDPGLAESKTIIFPVDFEDGTCVYDYRQQFDIDMGRGTWSEADVESKRLPRTGWTITDVSSEETSGENGRAVNILDGEIGTIWHTKYSGGTAQAPHSVCIDMKNVYEISGFHSVPRRDNSTNGLIREYIFYVSVDGKNWQAVSGGSWMPYDSDVYFEPVKARYVKLEALSGTYASMSEFYVLHDTDENRSDKMIPYYTLNSGAPVNSSVVEAEVGDDVKFSTATEGAYYGTWAFSGPNDIKSSVREYTINNLSVSDSGVYTSLYLNPYNYSNRVDYTLKVIDATSVDDVASGSAEVVSVRYYDLNGTELKAPLKGRCCIVKKIYDDGTVAVEKSVY